MEKTYKLMSIVLAAITLICMGTFLSMRPSMGSPGVSVAWTYAASAAAVDDGSVSKYETSSSYIRFKGTNTGSIYARINVEWYDTTNWNTLSVVYRDQDGSSTAYRVSVTLYRTKIRGTSLGATSTLVTFNSNSYAAATTSTQQHQKFFSHSFDFFNYAYYIMIEAYRSNTAQNPTIYGLQLLYWLQ